MDQAISKLLFIAAAIAVAAGVTGITWRTLSSNTPTENGPNDYDYANITTKELCDAIGGKWTTTGGKSSCAA